MTETDAIYGLAVAEKAIKPWVVEYVFNVLSELGSCGVRVALKSDAAPELRKLKNFDVQHIHNREEWTEEQRFQAMFNFERTASPTLSCKHVFLNV